MEHKETDLVPLVLVTPQEIREQSVLVILKQQEILALQEEVLHPKEPVPTVELALVDPKEPVPTEEPTTAEEKALVKSHRWVGKVANKIKKKAAVEKAAMKDNKRAAAGRLAVEKAALKLVAERTTDKELVYDKATSDIEAEEAEKKVQTAVIEKSSLNKVAGLNQKEKGDESITLVIKFFGSDKEDQLDGKMFISSIETADEAKMYDDLHLHKEMEIQSEGKVFISKIETVDEAKMYEEQHHQKETVQGELDTPLDILVPLNECSEDMEQPLKGGSTSNELGHLDLVVP